MSRIALFAPSAHAKQKEREIAQFRTLHAAAAVVRPYVQANSINFHNEYGKHNCRNVLAGLHTQTPVMRYLLQKGNNIAMGRGMSRRPRVWESIFTRLDEKALHLIG